MKRPFLKSFILLLSLALLPSVLYANPIEVSGKITDSKGVPLPGVTVAIKGTGRGINTNTDGRFTLTNVPSNGTLQISFVGYKKREIAVNSQTTINVTLEEESITLEEVVAVGYGVQKKVNLTGAVTAVSGKEMIKRPVLNAASMLQAQIPGLRVVQSSGQPGNESVSFRVRGQGTYSSAGSDPLILINGVPGSLTNLDPSIIESISVLKDASSASIYGSRAANGVILVTTKTGNRFGGMGKYSLSYSGNFSIYTPTRMLDLVTNSAEYMQLFNMAKDNSGRPGKYPDEAIKLYKDNPGSVKYPSFNWVGYMFNPAFVQDHNLTFSGSSDRTDYSITLNTANQPGTMRGFSYKKQNLSVDISSQAFSWLKVGSYITGLYGDRTEPRNGATDAFLATLSQAPTYMPWLPDDGSGKRRYTFTAFPGIEENNKNMVAMNDYGINVNNRSFDINGQLFAEVTPYENLKWYTKIAGRLYDNKKKDWSGVQIPLYSYSTGNFARMMDLGGGFIPGLVVEDQRTLYTNLYSYLEYKLPLGSNHNFRIMTGYSQEAQTDEVLWAKRRDYQFDLQEIDAGSTTNMENQGYKNQWALMSGFGRISYDYKSKYLLELNARYDGSSRISKETRWGLFPSMSAGYRITGEDYFKALNLSWIDNLKVRGSWGELGNQNIGLYPYQEIVDLVDSYSFDNSKLTQGVAQTSYINRNLKWETTTITNIGADFTLFRRLNIVFDWYRKITTNILRQAQVSSFIGLDPPTVNDGEMGNKGIELSVRWNDQVESGIFKGLQYNAGFYFDRSRNTLLKFGADEINSYSILREGTPYNSYYMLDAIGIFATQEEVNKAPKQYSDATRPGDIRYRDVNNDGKIDNNDKIVVDGRFPKFEYSFNAGVSWKNIDISVLFQGVAGKKTYVGGGHGIVPFYQGSAPTKDYISHMWTPENPYNAEYPRLYYADMGGGARNTRPSTYYLMDASFLRLKNAYIGYTLPEQWTARANIQRLRIFFSGDNLLTFTRYKGLDPERTSDGTYVTYPQSKIFSLGVNVEF